MNAHARRVVMCIAAQAVLGLSLAAEVPDWQAHVSPRLLNLWRSARPLGRAAAESTAEVTAPSTSVFTGRFDAKGRLQVDVSFDCAAEPSAAELEKLGMVSGTTLDVPPMCVVEGWAAIGSLPALAAISGVMTVDLPRYAKSRGAVTVNRHPIN